jgi:hypothetical protein
MFPQNQLTRIAASVGCFADTPPKPRVFPAFVLPSEYGARAPVSRGIVLLVTL